MALLRIRKPDGEIVEIASLPGVKGEDGKTPIKGVDYFTPEEQAAFIAEAKAYIDEQMGDVDAALDCILAIQESLMKGATIIRFTIDETSYQAEEGMTWGAWCASGYNIIGAFVDTENSVIFAADGVKVIGLDSNNLVRATEGIITDGEYRLVLY